MVMKYSPFFDQRLDWRRVFLQRLKVPERSVEEGIDTHRKQTFKKENDPMPLKTVSLPGSC